MTTKIINKQEQLDDQRKQLARLSVILEPLRKSISQLEDETAIERLKMYIGKYYVYRNSGGVGNKSWNLYVKPINVINGWQIRCLCAQKADYMTEIKLEDTSSDFLFQKEITKEEFDKGYNEILNDMKEAYDKK